METTIQEKISTMIAVVKDESYYEKTHVLSEKEREEALNNFLDAILSLKEKLNSSCDKLESLTDGYESLTWYTDLNEEDLKNLNDLIASSKDLRTVLIKNYVSFNNLRKKGIAKEELIRYKLAIDDFTEAYKDLETVFFYLPQNKEFQEVNSRLKNL